MEHPESFPIWDAQYVSPFGDALQKRIGLVRLALYNPRVKCEEELDKYAARTVGDPDLTKSKLSATAGIDGEIRSCERTRTPKRHCRYLLARRTRQTAKFTERGQSHSKGVTSSAMGLRRNRSTPEWVFGEVKATPHPVHLLARSLRRWPSRAISDTLRRDGKLAREKWRYGLDAGIACPSIE